MAILNISRLVELLLQEQGYPQHFRWMLSDVAVDRNQIPVRGDRGTGAETVSDDKGSGFGSGGGVILVVNRLPVLITWRGGDLPDFIISNDKDKIVSGIDVKELCRHFLTDIPNAEIYFPVIVHNESSDVHTELSAECSLPDLASLSFLVSAGLMTNCNRFHDLRKVETLSLKEKSHAQTGAVELQETSVWTNICSDVFQLILDALPLSACLNTREVCTFWKGEVKSYVLDKPPKEIMPWILYDEVERITSQSRVFYDPIGKIFCEIQLPIREGVRICAVWNGWLALLDSSGVTDYLILINPVNNSSIRIRIRMTTKEVITNHLAFFSSEPRNQQCVVMILGSLFWSIRRGNEEKLLRGLVRGTYTCYPASINGMFYFNCGPKGGYTGGKKIIELDISDDDPKFRTIEMSYGEWWLDAPQQQFLFEYDGSLCLARATYLRNNDLRLKLFRANLTDLIWVPLNTIGETALFIACNRGFRHGHCFSIKVSAGSEIKVNTAYITGSPLPRNSMYLEYDIARHEVRYFPKPITVQEPRFQNCILHWFMPKG